MQVPARHLCSGDRPPVSHLPLLFAHCEVIEELLGIQSGIDSFQIVIEKPQPLISLHDSLRISRLIRISILPATVIPGTNDRALIVTQRREAFDLGVSRAGVEPSAPAVDGRAGPLDLRTIAVHADSVDRYTERAIVAKRSVQRGCIDVDVLCAVPGRRTVKTLVLVFIDQVYSWVAVQLVIALVPQFDQPVGEHTTRKRRLGVLIEFKVPRNYRLHGRVQIRSEPKRGIAFIGISQRAYLSVRPRLRHDPVNHFTKVLDLVLGKWRTPDAVTRARPARVDKH